MHTSAGRDVTVADHNTETCVKRSVVRVGKQVTGQGSARTSEMARLMARTDRQEKGDRCNQTKTEVHIPISRTDGKHRPSQLLHFHPRAYFHHLRPISRSLYDRERKGPHLNYRC